MGPEVLQTSESLNIHPVALFGCLTELDLLHPLAVCKEEGQSPSPEGLVAYIDRKGPFEELSLGRHPVMPNTLLQLASSLAVLLSAWNVFPRIAKGMGDTRPSLRNFSPLSTTGGLPLNQRTSCFKQMLANTLWLAVSSSLKEARFSRILLISCPRLLEKCLLEFLS